MERVKHLKVPPTNYYGNRSRSASIDMIVMDEISKNGNWTTNNTTNNPPLVVVGDLDVNNNNNNNNNNNISPNLTSQSSGSTSAQNTLSQAGVFHINLSQLNNNNSANNSANNSPRYFSSLSSLQQPTHPSPPVSPRTQMTAPNLSTFIAQHTPPPSPKPSDDLRHYRHSNHLSPPPFSPNPLHHSGIYRNLSFNSSINSMSSIDISSKLLLQQAQQQSQLSNNNNNNNNNDTSDSNNNGNELTQSKIINARRKRKKQNKTIKRFRRVLFKIINSHFWIGLMVLAIIYILFIDDIIGISGSPSSNSIDVTIIVIKVIVLFFFTVDIISNAICYGRQYFPGTIIFWFDVISVLSIIPDIVVYSNNSFLSPNLHFLTIGKSARIIRICGCLVNVSLISTIYNRFLRTKHHVPLPSDGLEVEASKLGEKLLNLTTNKIVLLVLFVFFATQLFVYQSNVPQVYVESTLSTFEYMVSTFGYNSTLFENFTNSYIGASHNRVLRLVIGSHYIIDQSIDNIQNNAVLKYSFSKSSLFINNTEYIKYTSILHLCLTIFVIIILLIVNLLIVNDSHWLVINPLENVLTIVKFLSKQNSAMSKASAVRSRVESIGNKSEDTTSSSGIEDAEEPENEADFLLGMLGDIDDSLQAAKEKVEEESNQNTILKKDIEDLFVEKYILQIHLRSLIRKITFSDPIGMYLKTKQLRLLATGDDNESDDIRYKCDQENNVDKSLVLAGTIDKLVENLSIPEVQDLKFANVFLLTYRKFLSPTELLERLIIRFCVTPTMELPEKLLVSKESVEEWRKAKQEQIRVSVFNTIKLWISKYNFDFYSNPELYELFHNLVHKIMPFCRMDKYATHLDTFFKKKMGSFKPEREYIAPVPLQAEEIAQMMVLDDRLLYNFEINDIAIQMTLIEFDLFKVIKPQEFLDLAWTKKNLKAKLSPNILRFIDHFNNVSFWLQTLIVRSGKVKERVSILKKVISLGEHFIQLNNFYGAMEVLSSIESSSITRLHKTWEQLPLQSTQSLAALKKLLSPVGSFKDYREKLRQTTSACIPYIGIYLSDLTFIHEGNPDYRDDLINFSKQREIASTIISIQQFQNTYYYYETNERLRSQLLDIKGIDNDTIWKMSLTIERREERGEKKIKKND
ncbi:hypothetical protein CYY_005330 [Polysphondylium violaceum]|uniref:Ras guanine nucleotide exchange factor n=1 Tax=Polysphondylium violaceum TaxID=133409 RepID=A0A8J4PTE1_9MYCE|nr:hypothetical protein CYY_005330 [Polysphondylium violaceum]